MGKTIRNYIGKNKTHENARPYERTRENLTRNIDYSEGYDDADVQNPMEDQKGNPSLSNERDW